MLGERRGRVFEDALHVAADEIAGRADAPAGR
jgi:hypothetical protein